MKSAVALAKETIKCYLEKRNLPDIKDCPEELQSKKTGCFVTLHLKESGELRGCIGTILPTCKNLAGEIIMNAVQASTADPRFPPLTLEELGDIDISVDILSQPEPISTPEILDPKKYGVIVKARDGRTGLLLPDIEGVDNIDDQILIARQKAGILPEEPVSLFRFSVDRIKDL